MEVQSFTGVNPEKFQTICTKVKDKTGIAITENIGVDADGKWRVRWSYNVVSQTLLIQVIDKPWYVPESTVQSTIANLVETA